MPTPPHPFKLYCPKCHYTKLVRLQSDSLNIMDRIDIGPKCAGHMKQTNINATDNIFSNLFNKLFGK